VERRSSVAAPLKKRGGKENANEDTFHTQEGRVKKTNPRLNSQGKGLSTEP